MKLREISNNKRKSTHVIKKLQGSPSFPHTILISISSSAGNVEMKSERKCWWRRKLGNSVGCKYIFFFYIHAIHSLYRLFGSPPKTQKKRHESRELKKHFIQIYIHENYILHKFSIFLSNTEQLANELQRNFFISHSFFNRKISLRN